MPTGSPRRSARGASFDEIHAKAMAGDLAPELAPVELPEA